MAEALTASPKANREFKNSVFTLLFNEEEAIRDISGAVGAMLGEEISPNTSIKKTTLQNVLSSGKLNDLSFMLDDKLIVLIEHQSTINKNMPLRMLHYISEIYNRLYDKKDLYKKEKIVIPKPVFIVLYNGEEDVKDFEEYLLSDLFKEFDRFKDPLFLELRVLVYNINKGHSVDIVDQSPLLREYVIFVEEVREVGKEDGMTPELAMERAIENCIKKGILTNFLTHHKTEVMKMLVTEWDYDLDMTVAKEEAREDGLEEGLKKGLEKGREEERAILVKSMYENGLTVAQIVKSTNLSEKVIKQILDL
jgi:predicted transposase/invertase (TIGR01784 family)